MTDEERMIESLQTPEELLASYTELVATNDQAIAIASIMCWPDSSITGEDSIPMVISALPVGERSSAAKELLLLAAEVMGKGLLPYAITLSSEAFTRSVDTLHPQEPEKLSETILIVHGCPHCSWSSMTDFTRFEGKVTIGKTTLVTEGKDTDSTYAGTLPAVIASITAMASSMRGDRGGDLTGSRP